ncbi:helix-turn-helix domain-containing protein [Neolewinella persica]|uniref:helix-turn-helix domain-containing protein n=1 Tax=Neolewinella persica TaxID=70998 RepID=UPI000375463A|nr:helix-turn-helix domain-containing protein [Neolewinella persica]
MTTTTLLGILTLGILFIAMLMALFALVVPTQNRLANRLIAAYLMILAVTISVFFYHQHYSPPLVIEKLRDDINLLSAPLFYLFVRSLLYRDFKLRWQHLWHLTPFLLTTILFIPRFYGVPEVVRKEFFQNYLAHWETYAAMVIGHLQAIVYLVLVFVELARYRKILRENYADNGSETHKWLWQMNVLLSVLFLFSAFKNVFKRLVDSYEMITLVRIGMVSLLLGFLCWLLFKIMLHPNLFRGVESRLVPIRAGGAVAGAMEAEEQGEDGRIGTLQGHMETKRPYLNPTLTVRELANQLSWPDRELSLLINQDLNCHFFDFINDYRIKEAKRMLLAPENRKMTVLEILYAVGFNSKSSFNVAFKNRTGKTPTQFRRDYQASRPK